MSLLKNATQLALQAMCEQELQNLFTNFFSAIIDEDTRRFLNIKTPVPDGDSLTRLKRGLQELDKCVGELEKVIAEMH